MGTCYGTCQDCCRKALQWLPRNGAHTAWSQAVLPVSFFGCTSFIFVGFCSDVLICCLKLTFLNLLTSVSSDFLLINKFHGGLLLASITIKKKKRKEKHNSNWSWWIEEDTGKGEESIDGILHQYIEETYPCPKEEGCHAEKAEEEKKSHRSSACSRWRPWARHGWWWGYLKILNRRGCILHGDPVQHLAIGNS